MAQHSRHNPGFLKLVNEAKAKVKELSIEETWKLLQGPQPPLFVDIREDSEWALGHAKGAIHLGKGILEREIETLIPDKDREVVLYCGGGYRSALAADVLGQMGYSRVFSMLGGIRGWKEKGLPFEEG